MPYLMDHFPELTAALCRSLVAMNRKPFADQLYGAEIERTTFDDGAAYIYLLPSRELHAAEFIHHKGGIERTVEVDTPYGTFVDIDALDRVVGIELVNGKAFEEELSQFPNLNSGLTNTNNATPISNNPYAAPQPVAERIRSSPRTSLFHQLIGWTCAVLCAVFGVVAFANLIIGDYQTAAGGVLFTLLFGWLARDFVKNTTYDGR